MGKVDVVVVGYVFQLSGLVGDDWETGIEDGKEKLFAWQKRTLPSGSTIAFLECMASLWGDASRELVRSLKELNGARCVIYVGKAGSLRLGDPPNALLVTGSNSYLGSELTSWDNVLNPAASEAEGVLRGDIVTVMSPLLESAAWLAEWQPKCDWVDCEVGHMALASREQNTGFGYLLLISNNVARYGRETLANEDSAHIQRRREVLFRRVEDVLRRFLDEN
ncbi:hypothetical protein OQA88_13368 [Cercophora sp. LCS_1]